MAVLSVEELYERYVRPLPASDRLRLVSLVAAELSRETTTGQPAERSLLELEGLGAELWKGIDAQQYVNAARDEWDDRR